MNTRQKGALKLLISTPVFVVILCWVYTGNTKGTQHTYEPTLMALPGAYAMVGLIELVSGTPFSQFNDLWMNLKGWQRGVFGTVFLLLVFVAMFAGMYFFLQ